MQIGRRPFEPRTELEPPPVEGFKGGGIFRRGEPAPPPAREDPVAMWESITEEEFGEAERERFKQQERETFIPFGSGFAEITTKERQERERAKLPEPIRSVKRFSDWLYAPQGEEGVVPVAIVSNVGLVGSLVGMGIFVGVTSWDMLLDKALRSPQELNKIGRVLTRAGLKREFARYMRATGTKIDKVTQDNFINRYLKDMAAFFETGVKSQAEKGTLSIATLQQTATATYSKAVERFRQTFVPRGTQTGAMAQGGLPTEPIRPEVPAVGEVLDATSFTEIKRTRLSPIEQEVMGAVADSYTLYGITIEGKQAEVALSISDDVVQMHLLQSEIGRPINRSFLKALDEGLNALAVEKGASRVEIRIRPENASLYQRAGYEISEDKLVASRVVTPTPPTVTPEVTPVTEQVTPVGEIPVEPVVTPTEAIAALTVAPEAPSIPPQLPTTPPPLSPEAGALGRTENEWTGLMADLQEADVVADVAFRDDMVRRWINLLPEIRGFINILNPSAVANTPAEQSLIVRAVLRDEGVQKSQGVIAFISELGNQEKIFGNLDNKGLIKTGALKGQSLGDVAEHRPKWEGKLTDQQKVWLDRAKVVEDSIVKFLERNGIEVTQLRLEEGGQFATRRVWARTTKSGEVVDTAYVGAGPGRPGGRLPTEKHRIFKTEAEAIEAGYRYLPYEEALYLKVAGAYNRVADKKMADWLLNKVTWRTTGAPEELKLAAESALGKKRHSQQLLGALNRAVRGERVPDVTTNAIAASYPNEAQRLKALIPRIQANEPTAREVQDLTRVAKGLIDSDKKASQRAINARARARERALVTKLGEATIPAPAFAGKILTGKEAVETARVMRQAFDPSFSKALGEVNKANAVARYFMLAGDFSPFAIQLLFLAGENPVIYGKAFQGAMRALFNPEFHSSYLTKHKATIDKHPNLLIAKSGSTEFTEAMARGGWLSGKTALIPEAESYWKTLEMILPRAIGKVGATALTPFQRVFESALDIAGIELAEAYDYLATTPQRTADLDQFINEFRGLTSSARIGVDVLQRQIETAAILAPRYNRAIAGLLYDMSRGGIRGALARKSMAKGVAAVAAIAVLISLARGETPEEIADHFNPTSPNFVTWDVAGQRIGPGTKVRSVIKLFAQSAGNPESLFQLSMDNPALRFIRGNLSPVASTGLDLILGKDYVGDPTRDGLLSFTKTVLGRNLTMIWVQTVLMEGGELLGRTVRGVTEFFGGRAYPEPVWGEVGRLRDKYAKQDFKIKYEDLNRAQIDRLNLNHPDLKDLEEKARTEGAERGSEFDKWLFETREQITTERDTVLDKAATALQSNLISKYDYDKERGYARPYYSGASSVLWLARESLDPFSIKQIEKWMGDNQKPEDKALDKYQEYRANIIQRADLPKDWDRIEAQSEAYLAKLPKNIRDYVRTGVNLWINDLPENARQVELMRLQGIEDGTWWNNYRDNKTSGVAFPKRTTTEGRGFDLPIP